MKENINLSFCFMSFGVTTATSTAMMVSASWLLVCLISVQSTSSGYCDRDSADSCKGSIVKVADGQLAGNTIQFEGKRIQEFLNIPFAQPPITDRRFLNPERLTSGWNGIRDAKQYGPACMQPPSKGQVYSEDCLQLNVWTPEVKGSTKGKHVMVYFHGGSFNTGSASEEESNGTVLAAKYDVVVVTANYRLGFLGYLYPDDHVNSNMGQRDQQVALQWVRQNIHAFGGDADSMSIFGHSAGAISAGILSLSPLTNSLFNRAILQSGSPYSFLRPDSPLVAQTKSRNLSRFVNCSSMADEKISQPAFQCLQAVPAEIILQYAPQEKTHSRRLPNPMFGDSFLPTSIATLLDKKLQQSNLKPIDMIIGFQSGDAELFVMAQTKNVFGSKNRDKDVTYDQVLGIVSTLFDGRLDDAEQEQMMKHYLSAGRSMSSDQLKSTLIRMYGDLYVYCPSYFLADELVKSSDGGAKVYMYELRSKASKPKHKHCLYTCHGEEIPFVFGAPFLHPQDYDDNDRRLSDRVMDHWTQFAKKGIPDKKWISFNESRKYLLLEKGDDDRPGGMSDEKFANCDSLWRPIFNARK